MQVINVHYEGQQVGAVSLDTATGHSSFEYAPSFIQTGIELSPLHLPLKVGIFAFPELDPGAFKGLPGILADALPDDFGNTVLNAWVAREGRSPRDISSLQRLQYTGTRGMGALEFHPATRLKSLNASENVAIEALVQIAQEVLDARKAFEVQLHADGPADQQAMRALLSVGTSAGGARPKAVLAFNHDFSEARSGQTEAPEGFTHYLLKFDGVNEHQSNQETFGDPRGFGAMEYVYYQMACACGIDMMPCQLIQEGHRRHFATQRFDRRHNRKIHVQTLNGMDHASYKQVGRYSYAEIFSVMRRLGLCAVEAEQLFRRMVFNVVARNHDDHTKNFAFMLEPDTRNWRLAPAYDIAYSYKPGSPWVNSHAMTINGKRDGFTRADFYAFGSIAHRFKSRSWVDQVIDETQEVVSHWPTLARQQEVPASLIALIEPNLRLSL